MVAPTSPAADKNWEAYNAPKASATLDGKKCKFPETGIADGVKATTALLESCHDKSEGTAADLKKAQMGAAGHRRDRE